jgi:hypothetical protein
MNAISTKSLMIYKFFLFVVLSTGLLISIIIGFEHLLDDTFIYLRYSKNFIETGRIFYNQNQESFGVSSLGYLFYISSFLRLFTETSWPLLLKLSSIFFHIITLVIALVIITQNNKEKLDRIHIVLITSILFFLFCVPSVGRWLNDGMETSIGVFLAFLSVYTLTNIDRIKNNYIINFLLSIIIVLPGILRIDLIPIVAANMILLILIRKDTINSRRLLFIIAPIILLFWLLLTCLYFNSFIPDSALAKQSGQSDIFWFFYFIKSILSTSPIWLGSIIIAIIFLITFKYIERKYRIMLLAGLIPITSQVIAGSLYGQAIHGARYFLPSIAYLIGIVFYVVNQKHFFNDIPKFKKFFSYLIILVIFLSIIHTIIILLPINRVLQKSYLIIPEELTAPNITICAADIGQIGWYSNATIFDLSALVNGRDIAKTKLKCRLEKLLTTMGFPDYLILKQEDLQEYKINKYEITLINGNQSQHYIKTNQLIMKLYNIDRSLDWILWIPKKSLNKK